MHLTQTIKSASFKLTAAYVGLFCVSFGVLAGITYFSVTGELSRQFHSRIGSESRALEADFKSGGVPQLLRTISERQRGHLIGGLDYSLVNKSGRHIFGTMPAVPCIGGWTTLVGPPDGDEDPGEMEKLGVNVTPLPGGLCLFVGNDWGEVQKTGELVLKTFGWVFLLSLTMAVAGGLFLSANFMKRIDAINKTAEAIIEGDVRRRIPRRNAPDDLDKLASTLNRMLDRMTALMESLKHLSNDIAHDLRTPLGRLRRLLDSARGAEMSTLEYQSLIEQGVVELDEILDLFGAILRISQIESGDRRSGFQRLSLSNLVQDLCDTFAPALEEDGKLLKQDLAPDLFINGDPELLALALSNLLENANLHTPAGAHVEVSLQRRGDQINLIVADDGPGVPEFFQKRIFERFYRMDSSRATVGNGLGLSIVSAVVDLHSAEVHAGDNGPGLRVSIVFASLH